MLCGFLPFQDSNTSKLYKKILLGKFDLPKMLSSASIEILKGILNVNPEFRWKIDQIKKSKWFHQNGTPYRSEGVLLGRDTVQADKRVINIMKQKGFDREVVENFVNGNRHNNVTAYYYLLKKKA